MYIVSRVVILVSGPFKIIRKGSERQKREPVLRGIEIWPQQCSQMVTQAAPQGRASSLSSTAHGQDSVPLLGKKNLREDLLNYRLLGPALRGSDS